MALSSELQKSIIEAVKRRPDTDIPIIVSEVLETLGGQDPNLIVQAIKSSGGPRELVQEVQAEIRRIKSIGAHRA